MATLNVLMDGDKSVCCFFRKKKFNLTTSVNPVESGTITGAGKYDKGTNVSVEATPTVDFEFDHWEVNGEETEGEEEPPIIGSWFNSWLLCWF